MLPGFRFLLTAIVLSLSILVFGLGAAALLRAAHEEFASNPSWHAAPETTFAQQGEATRETARPVLALLRVDTPAVDTPKIETPSADVPLASASPAGQAAISSAALPDPGVAATKIATLGGPPVTIEPQRAGKVAGAKPDRSVIEKRLQARRAALRRRMAARARLARQMLLLQQQAANPFLQPALQSAIQPGVQPAIQPANR